MSYSVKIRDIENENNGILKKDFSLKIEELSAEVESSLVFKSLGEFIELKGNVNGKIDLECDVCLNPYTEILDFEIHEMYAKTSLYGEYGSEVELKSGEFVTDLNGADEIDVYDLLYQSVILNFPNKKVCGINCKGKEYLTDEDNYDPRLEVFNNLQINPEK